MGGIRNRIILKMIHDIGVLNAKDETMPLV